MFPSIKLTVFGDQPRLSGFKFWWLKSVVSYRMDVHCARCLVGKYERRVSKDMLLNHPVELIGDLVYLCGVSPRWSTNFHAAVALEPGSRIELPTYNGLTVRFDNGRLIPIEPLEEGWNGLPREFTTCRNYQFAVQMKGAIASSTSA